MLGANGQTYSGLRDVLLCELLGRELRVSCGGWVDGQTLHIGNVGQEREDLEIVNELPSRILAAFELEGEDGTTALWEVLLIEVVGWVALQSGVAYAGHFGMLAQVLYNLEGVAYVSLNTQR